MAKTLLCLSLLICASEASAQYLQNGVGPALTGAYGAVIVHESGHALAARLLGKEIEIFRAYPSKMLWQMPDGRVEEKWSLGMVKIRSDGSDEPWKDKRQNAIYSAMGSGTNAMAVVLLAPLLPKLTGFGSQSLDDMLVFSTFDLPSYVFVDALGLTKGTGDWNQVSRTTGISIYWWLIGSLGESLLLNQYRLYWRNQTPDGGTIKASTGAVIATKISF